MGSSQAGAIFTRDLLTDLSDPASAAKYQMQTFGDSVAARRRCRVGGAASPSAAYRRSQLVLDKPRAFLNDRFGLLDQTWRRCLMLVPVRNFSPRDHIG
jgi:hypothetical protein